mmetsp:Transcript_37333/g.88339  ORF Transcript_37333/g.88339 Transcript_37333/m.88339 type:complete len:285 (+) Transcript_37333:1792-2646(+)
MVDALLLQALGFLVLFLRRLLQTLLLVLQPRLRHCPLTFHLFLEGLEVLQLLFDRFLHLELLAHQEVHSGVLLLVQLLVLLLHPLRYLGAKAGVVDAQSLDLLPLCVHLALGVGEELVVLLCLHPRQVSPFLVGHGIPVPATRAHPPQRGPDADLLCRHFICIESSSPPDRRQGRDRRCHGAQPSLGPWAAPLHSAPDGWHLLQGALRRDPCASSLLCPTRHCHRPRPIGEQAGSKAFPDTVLLQPPGSKRDRKQTMTPHFRRPPTSRDQSRASTTLQRPASAA